MYSESFDKESVDSYPLYLNNYILGLRAYLGSRTTNRGHGEILPVGGYPHFPQIEKNGKNQQFLVNFRILALLMHVPFQKIFWCHHWWPLNASAPSPCITTYFIYMFAYWFITAWPTDLYTLIQIIYVNGVLCETYPPHEVNCSRRCYNFYGRRSESKDQCDQVPNSVIDFRHATSEINWDDV